jgi:hypothetical protein
MKTITRFGDIPLVLENKLTNTNREKYNQKEGISPQLAA